MRISNFVTSAIALALMPAFAAAQPLPNARPPLLKANPATARIAQDHRWFVVKGGGVFTIRGGNVSLPEFKGTQASGDRWSPETPQQMARQGFNGIRLVMFFSELMPQPGKINEAYLDRIAQAVAVYKAAGIYTLIDFHQDQYSAVVGVRGMPAWAVFSDGYKRIPGVDFPIGYFKDPAVQRSFDNFYKNHPVPGTGKGVQDFYIDGLAAVARRFRNETAVLGIDVMNEPSSGTRCAIPDPAKANCPELEQELLKPFYRRAADAINAAAPDMIVFVEPFMLQAGLGTPIRTPIAGVSGRRALSFHNYGPVQELRDRISDSALAHAAASDATIINTEWGFSNEPSEIVSQANDFDQRHISWLAWTRGSFEALVDPKLPDRGNGNRVAILRAYARPYAEVTAGTPEVSRFDPAKGILTLNYTTTLPSGRRADGGETRVRLPAVHYPQGYRVDVEGAEVLSQPNAPILRVRNLPRVGRVMLKISRVGELPPLPATKTTSDYEDALLRALPPIPAGPLNRQSLLGHIIVTPGGKSLIDRHAPGLLRSLSHVHGVMKMSLATIQELNGGALPEQKMVAIEADLKQLKVTPGPVNPVDLGRLSVASLTSDLIADPRARAILDKEAPGLTTSPKQTVFPQTRLRNLQPEMPELLTDAVLARIDQALSALK